MANTKMGHTLFIYLFNIWYFGCIVLCPLFCHGNWPFKLFGLVGLRPLTQVLNNLYAVESGLGFSLMLQ
jgi:hypothetical protein